MQIWLVTHKYKKEVQKIIKNFHLLTHSQNRERNHYFFPPTKQGFTRVSFLFFLRNQVPKNVLFFSFFLRDQVPKNVFFPFSFNKKPLSVFLSSNVSNNVLFSFTFSLSVVFSLDKPSNGIWDLCSYWSRLKSLILFLSETIPLRYKFML